MIKLTVGNNTNKRSDIVNESEMTPRRAFDAMGIPYTGSFTMINGTALSPGDMDKTFADLGVRGDATLYAMAKSDNANA